MYKRNYYAMRSFIDFVVPWNDNPAELGAEIIRHITCNRITAKKPCVMFITGGSGEGKSYTGLKIIQIINDYYGVNTEEVINDAVVYTPLEYVTKLNNCLFYKDNKRMDLKKLRVIMIDEAREVVRATLWYKFVNQAIGDCNAMSRSVKPIVFIIVSQFVKDIDVTVRRTIDYYGNCRRPLSGPTQLELYNIWKDDTDIERPALRKRRLRGYITKNHKRRVFKPTFEISLPPKNVIDTYEEHNFKSKTRILRKKIETTLMAMEKEIGRDYDKVDALVNYYVDSPNQLRLIRDPRYKKFRLKPDFRKMHDLTTPDAKEFEKRLIEKLVEKGLFSMEK